MKNKLISVFIIIVILFLLRYPILRAMGTFLICEDEPPATIENLFVLSGHYYDRGTEAARIFDSLDVKKIICTGKNHSGHILTYYGETIVEPMITKKRLTNLGVPDSSVEIIIKGTSTIEESEIILNYCIENKLHSCVVVSTKFHTRRVKMAFKKKMRRNGIKLHIIGAPAAQYHESRWWTYEVGLITVSNEYFKILYYMIKY